MRNRMPGVHSLNTTVAWAKGKRWLWILIRYLLIIGISYVILYPLIVKFSVAFMAEQDFQDLTVKWIPRHFTLDNFKNAIEAMNFGKAFTNTAIITVGTTLLQTIICSAGAYGLVKYRFRGSRILLALIVFSLIVPPQTYMSATYMQFRFFDLFGLLNGVLGSNGLLNTYFPFFIKSLFGQGLRNGLYVYLFVQFYRGTPMELEEAAQVDGAGPWKTFVRIAFPNARPIVVTLCVISAVWQWNDVFFAHLLAPQMDLLASNVSNIASMLLGDFNTSFLVEEPARLSAAKNAAAILLSVPLIVFFAVIQRYFTENLERSGIVG